MRLTSETTENKGCKHYFGSERHLRVGSKIYSKTNAVEGAVEEAALKAVMPQDAISRDNCLFIVRAADDADALDLLKCVDQSTEYVYEVRPLGDVEPSDFAWLREISLTALDEPGKPYLAQAVALNYWTGFPFPDETKSAYHYRVRGLRVLRKVEKP